MSVYRCTFTVLATCLLMNTVSHAEAFPHGCEVSGFGYSNYHLIVNETGDQAFYLIQNRSDRTIELQRIETREVFMSPPLTAKLEPANWAAFASDIREMHFQCFYTENENTAKVNCRDVLDVCQYPRVKFALSNMGNYWVSTNKSQRQVINDAAAKGIYLRW
ncbi:enhanced entry protein EnhB [Legionella sp. MW5194]|uniref:enhanced entry protein EnhB n=1 Tax=Legionella sp. MW5194 TaxID=2662448 RepID=UPI00193EA33D|nr:enhanced entry protein EnhB [Legionella sp. MW5194]